MAAGGGVALAAGSGSKQHVPEAKHPSHATTPHHCPNMANTGPGSYSGLDM